MVYLKGPTSMMVLMVAVSFSLFFLMVPLTASCQVSCVPPMISCGGVCTNLLTDPNNCGVCGNPCSLANATAFCSSGLCWVKSCNFGWGDCDGVVPNGCETNVLTNSKNCGGCFNTCQGGTICFSGQCQ
jgi:hypothetical protein